jgi:hypothetical protein
MLSRRAVRLSIPPFLIFFVEVAAFAASRHSPQIILALQLPLALLVTGCAIASVVILMRLPTDKGGPELRVPFVLNAIVVIMSVVTIVVGAFMPTLFRA